ncbi:MAG: DNA primase [Patescibacteria group bacterium]|nr:DNA primase [Patescibacteria group bacterium]
MDEVANVREKIDIVSFISEYIPLKKAGRNFKANCPFHSEKTPSFVVSPERQIWHCFGCGKGGDAFTFLMDYDSLEFVEALRILAKKTGIELQEHASFKTETSQKERIYRLNNLACDFYHYLLTKHPIGKPALSYLTKVRKIDPRIIETFMLGFSPGRGAALSNYLIDKKKYKRGDLTEAGLSFEREGRIVDFFRNRIMFPLFDHRDNIVGFSGRSIDQNSQVDGGSKYVNTKDTPAYHKGSMFFGLNMARDEIKKNGQAIIVEGEFDVISCYAAGIKNVVAIKGTALTDNQVTLIARYAPKVTLCLDQDEAGFEAIRRSLPVLEKKGLTTTIISLGNFKDPDEAISRDPFFFKKSVKNEIGIYDFLIERFLKRVDKKTALGKKEIANSLLPFLSLIDNQIVKEHYLKNLSLELDTSYENLVLEMEKLSKKEEPTSSFISGKKDKRERKEVLEEYLLSLVFQSEDIEGSWKIANSTLLDYSFELASYQKIFALVPIYFQNHKVFQSKLFGESLPKEIISVFDTCFIFPLPKFQDIAKYNEELEKVAKELRILYIKNKIKFISQNTKDENYEKNQKELAALISLLPKS